MAEPLPLRLVDWRIGIRTIPTRLPFRFGVVTVSELPEATLEVTVEDLAGRRQTGHAADFLSIRWFDRRPKKLPGENVADLLDAVRIAAALAVEAARERARPPFDLWTETFSAVCETVLARGGNRLIASFGASMVERAVLDAAARLCGLPVDQFLRDGLSGLDLRRMHPCLDAVAAADLLAPLPMRMPVRHTVGYVDPLVRADLTEGRDPADGEPVTLEDYLRRHRLHFLKVVITGKPESDADRLARIAAVLHAEGRCLDVTLDGGEQYSEPSALAAFFDILRRDPSPAVQSLCGSLLWIEQPVTRDQSLDSAVMADTVAASGGLPLVLDEGDDGPEVFEAAMRLGWRGVSHKNCKGVYKSISNLAMVRAANATGGEHRYFLTGEDLSTMPVVALQADTVVAAALGIPHVQRNGHHFFRTSAALSAAETAGLLARHSDLYAPVPGGVRLRIDDGAMSIGSLRCPGMGFAVEPDLDAMTPAEDWSFEARADGAVTIVERAQFSPSRP